MPDSESFWEEPDPGRQGRKGRHAQPGIRPRLLTVTAAIGTFCCVAALPLALARSGVTMAGWAAEWAWGIVVGCAVTARFFSKPGRHAANGLSQTRSP